MNAVGARPTPPGCGGRSPSGTDRLRRPADRAPGPRWRGSPGPGGGGGAVSLPVAGPAGGRGGHGVSRREHVRDAVRRPVRRPAGRPGAVASGRRADDLAVGDGLIGRVLDGRGRVIDGRPAPPRPHAADPHAAPPPALGRPPIRRDVRTGVRVVDGLLTVGRGQRVGLFAGSGVGKSTLLAQLARGSGRTSPCWCWSASGAARSGSSSTTTSAPAG